ncbi:MAG: sulfite exporter TauE/SafE family protein [Anaerolinea sp.]|nr:sulfite exporter TauE/SafE family protein [Anaerolinea sp.]
MIDLWVIFLTGLTTGGLTCLAIQGGLLATTLAQPETISTAPKRKHPSKKHPQAKPQTQIILAQNLMPILYFLAAKVFSHTLLGFGLGALGGAFQITPVTRAILQLAAGFFMLGTALNMYNVHPVFRYFAIQPPKTFTRLMRNQSKSREIFTPALLGFLTVLIPCGTTQAMAVLAVSSGNALTGAAIMAVFVLGTAPTFFALGFLALRLSGRLKQTFATATALLILFLGIVAVDSGLNLLGSPLAPRRVIAALLETDQVSGSTVEAISTNGVQEIRIQAHYSGYIPNQIRVQRGQPIRLRVFTKENYTCSSEFVIPALNIYRVLPATGETVINLPPQNAGRLYFSCGMGMFTGTIIVV